jgi:hypothetical protein
LNLIWIFRYSVSDSSNTTIDTNGYRLAKTTGLAKIVEWIKEARREVDIMDDSNDGDQEARKVLISAIQALGRAPVEYRQDFVGTIKSLTNDQKYPAGIVVSIREGSCDHHFEGLFGVKAESNM